MNSGEPGHPQNESMRRQILKDKEPQKMFRQSDYPIVSMKSTKVDGEKGIEGMRMDIRETTATHRGGDGMATKLMTITMRAKENPKLRFTSLIHLLNEEFLMECFEELKQDKAPGIDGVRIEEYEVNKEANIKDLINRMKAWRYIPQPTRRVYIPKTNGDKRPLGIPAVEDKIIQMGVKKILESIFEVDFSEVSYGFRPDRNCHQALKILDKEVMTKPVNAVVDMDIEKFFDTINHKWLMKCLTQRIADTNLIRLIGRILNAGIMEEGKFIETDKGTPQGGILSPLLANIYLHYILDLWFERHVKRQLKGYASLIRYADDFVVLFQYDSEAKEFGEMLRQRLDKFGLKIAKDKSRIIVFGRHAWYKSKDTGGKIPTFDFLGFTHYCDKTRKGGFKLGRRTASTKFKQKMKATNFWLKSVRNLVELKQWWQALGRKLTGHYNYYGISGNMPQITKFYWRNRALAYKWINRRSQKRSYNWEQFCRFLRYNPLPEPRIYHLTYSLSSY